MTTVCSALSLELGEELAGTAPEETGFVVVERSSPWSRDAVKDVGLPAVAGVRVQVVRRGQGRYATPPCAAWVACVLPGRRFLERLTLDSLEELSALDLAGVAEGRPTGAGTIEPDPLFLVCTHGVRDPCCAKHGLPLARALARFARGRAWQTSHLGGHRFAPTMAVLPHGVWLGRVPAARAREVAEGAREDRFPPDLLRGRAGLSPAAQVADASVRLAENLSGIDEVRVDAVNGAEIRLSGPAGRRWNRYVRHRQTGRARPLSCGEGPKVEDPGVYVVEEH